MTQTQSALDLASAFVSICRKSVKYHFGRLDHSFKFVSKLLLFAVKADVVVSTETVPLFHQRAHLFLVRNRLLIRIYCRMFVCGVCVSHRFYWFVCRFFIRSRRSNGNCMQHLEFGAMEHTRLLVVLDVFMITISAGYGYGAPESVNASTRPIKFLPNTSHTVSFGLI